MDCLESLKLGVVRQIYPQSARPPIRAELERGFQAQGLTEALKPGARVLITSGSRGIESMTEVVREIAALVRAAGASPMILPAMGSHGGGTAQGQVEVLEHLGQTEATLMAPIIDGYEPTVIGQVFDSLPVSVDRAALPGQCDQVILVGRVKEHSEFTGPIESGLTKMAVVGLGRVDGAAKMHSAAVRHTYSKTLEAMARVIFQKVPVLCGVALIEDQRNILHSLEVVPAADIIRREPELLAQSKLHKPSLPYESLDVLVVDEMGKDISGSGLDTKVVGRIMNIYEKEPDGPRITRLVTLRMSPKGGGNAIGVGLNDFITRELFEAIDLEMTALNSIVAVSPEKGRIPIIRPQARSALAAAIETVGPRRPQELELAWIANTKDLEYLAVSQALWDQAADKPALERLGAPRPMPFRSDGSLPALADWRS
ncbi:MAG: DUF2088 domain-containing protein [Candidatus Adiutrix sp.]|jgi:hypothetical protein|nr:DUF2088 domain-containing protein [Candidatus Adiutrix sp.]